MRPGFPSRFCRPTARAFAHFLRGQLASIVRPYEAITNEAASKSNASPCLLAPWRFSKIENGPMSALGVFADPMTMSDQILVIEDDFAVRELILQTLSRAGYEVIAAGDGVEGLNLFREKNPSLVITDIVMPQKEGLQTIIELRQEAPDVKVIAMSGGGRYCNADYLKLARKFGARRTVSKPFMRDEMLAVVREVLAEN